MSRNATLFEAASIALGSLRASKLRSALTLLGVILATTTLIAVMSVIEGMNRYIAEHINEVLGAGSFVIARIVMLGNDVKERIFPGVEAVGKAVDLDGIRVEVVGVAKAKGSVFGNSMGNFVVIPIETHIKYYGVRQGLAYHALAQDGRLPAAQDEVRQLLRAWRHVRPRDDDNFGVFTADAVVSIWKQMTAAIAGTAVAIVSVFMVVGGVVIMNIMLAVVTERTYETGIRKAVGARRSDILGNSLLNPH